MMPKRDRLVRTLIERSREFNAGLCQGMNVDCFVASEVWRQYSHDLLFIEKVDALMGGKAAGLELGAKLKEQYQHLTKPSGQ